MRPDLSDKVLALHLPGPKVFSFRLDFAQEYPRLPLAPFAFPRDPFGSHSVGATDPILLLHGLADPITYPVLNI